MLRRSLGFVALPALAALAACARPTPIVGHAPPLALGAATESPPVPVVPPPIVTRLAASRTGSGVLLPDLNDRRVAYVSDEDAQLVRVIDLASEKELSRFAPGGAPGQLAMLKDGRLA